MQARATEAFFFATNDFLLDTDAYSQTGGGGVAASSQKHMYKRGDSKMTTRESTICAPCDRLLE